MNNLEVDRLIRELHIIGTQLKRIADVAERRPVGVVAEPSPFESRGVTDDTTSWSDTYSTQQTRPERPVSPLPDIRTRDY